MKRSRYQGCRSIAGLFVILLLLLSCESTDRYVGVYKAVGWESADRREITIELKEHGDGVWKVGPGDVKGTSAEVPFTWYIKGGDLRINTKAGGVIVGKIDKDTIHVTLPGSKALTFRKTQ